MTPPTYPRSFESFTCPICYKDISADRSPNLNLDNCSCGEKGTQLNDPENSPDVFVDPLRDLHTQEMIREDIYDENRDGYHNRNTDLLGRRAAGDDEDRRFGIDTTKEGNREDDHEASTSNDEDISSSPPTETKESSPLSFTMQKYLSAISPSERSYHTSSLDLYLPPPNLTQNPLTQTQLHLTQNLIPQTLSPPPTISIYSYATKASSGKRSTWSIGSWGSQRRGVGEGGLGGEGEVVWTGGWMEESLEGRDLEMSWPPVLCGSGVLGGEV